MDILIFLIGGSIVIALSILFLVKNEKTCRIQHRRIDEISDYQQLLIKQNTLDISEIRGMYKAKMRTYESILYNPLIWTYEQAYPNPVEHSGE